MEIERKFLVKRLPNVKPDRIGIGYQTYLSIDPYIRVRKFLKLVGDEPAGDSSCYITVKGTGSLSRIEVEIPITSEQYYDILAAANSVEAGRAITKKNHHYLTAGPADEGLRIDIVDEGKPYGFMYAEKEFATEEEAAAYVFPFPECEPVDVTDDPQWKMNNYWKRTRLEQKEKPVDSYGMLEEISSRVYDPELDEVTRNNDDVKRVSGSIVIKGDGEGSEFRYTVRDLIMDLLRRCDLDMPIQVPDTSIRLPYTELEYDTYGPPHFDKNFTTLSLRTGSVQVTRRGITEAYNRGIIKFNEE